MELLPKPKNNKYTLKHLRDVQKKGLSLQEALEVIALSYARDSDISLSVNLANALLKRRVKVRYK